MTLLTDYEAAHARWVAAWDRIGHFVGPCGLCGYPDSRHRIADALVDQYRTGADLTEIADEYGVSIYTAAYVVAAGLDAELTRLAARVPRGREPPGGDEQVSTTSTT